MKKELTKYVWYQDRYWRVEGLVDYRGFIGLVRLFDSSQGINADPAKIRNASVEQIDAIERIIENGRTLSC